MLTKEVTLSTLVDWVNVVQLTELYEYSAKEEYSIASVMALLEILDEGVNYSDKEYAKMIECLETNTECEQ